MNRIIDKDIEMYEATMEKHNRDIMRCHPNMEDRHDNLYEKAHNVLISLLEYRDAIDREEPEDPSATFPEFGPEEPNNFDMEELDKQIADAILIASFGDATACSLYRIVPVVYELAHEWGIETAIKYLNVELGRIDTTLVPVAALDDLIDLCGDMDYKASLNQRIGPFQLGRYVDRPSDALDRIYPERLEEKGE